MSKEKLLRVTQMNAIFLDNEIHRALLQLLQDSNRYFPTGFTGLFEPEMNLLVRMAILTNSVWRNGSTFGQQLLSIKYKNMTKIKAALYIMSDCLEYFRRRLELWKPAHHVNNAIFKLQLAMVVLNFVNMSVFLRGGVKPRLVERALCLNQAYASETAPRQFESKYLARELLWNGFIEIFIHLLPLVNYHKIMRIVRSCNPLHKRPSFVTVADRVMTLHSKCAHCGNNPILPHHMGCAHVFCYVCLKGNQAADSRFECPICEHRNPNVLCDRVSM